MHKKEQQQKTRTEKEQYRAHQKHKRSTKTEAVHEIQGEGDGWWWCSCVQHLARPLGQASSSALCQPLPWPHFLKEKTSHLLWSSSIQRKDPFDVSKPLLHNTFHLAFESSTRYEWLVTWPILFVDGGLETAVPSSVLGVLSVPGSVRTLDGSRANHSAPPLVIWPFLWYYL